MGVYLERVDPEQNMARFYLLALEPRLLSEWAMNLKRGRIGSPGHVRELSYDCEADAQAAHAERSAKRLRQGDVLPRNLGSLELE